MKKAQRVLGIRRNLWSCNSDNKTTAYKALVQSVLEYGFWDPHLQKNKDVLNFIQKQAARFCISEYGRDPGTVTKLLKDLDWEPLEEGHYGLLILCFTKWSTIMSIYPSTSTFSQIITQFLYSALSTDVSKRSLFFNDRYKQSYVYKMMWRNLQPTKPETPGQTGFF